MYVGYALEGDGGRVVGVKGGKGVAYVKRSFKTRGGKTKGQHNYEEGTQTSPLGTGEESV